MPSFMTIRCHRPLVAGPGPARRRGKAPPSRAAGVALRVAPGRCSPTGGPFFTPLTAKYDKRIGQHYQRHMVMPTDPAAPLKVIQAEFVLHLLVTMLHPPAAFRRPNQPPQGCRGGQVVEEKLRGRRLASRPFHQQPAGGARLLTGTQPMRRSYPPGCEATGQFPFAAL